MWQEPEWERLITEGPCFLGGLILQQHTVRGQTLSLKPAFISLHQDRISWPHYLPLSLHLLFFHLATPTVKLLAGESLRIKHTQNLLTYSVTWLLPIKKWSLTLSSDPLLQSGWKPHQWIEGILVNCTTWALGKLQNPPLPSQTFLLGIQLPFSQETQAASLSMLREN